MADPPPRKRPRAYKKFDPASKIIRQSVISSLATTYLDHLNSNGGKCRRGFLAGLVDQAATTTIGLEITKSDIRNEAQRRRASGSNVATPSPSNIAAPNLNLLAVASSIASASESSSGPTEVVVVAPAAPPPASSTPAAPAPTEPAPHPSAASAPAPAPPSAPPPPPAAASRNLHKGGRPKGTTDADKRAAILAKKKATNWVTIEFAAARSELEHSNPNRRKRSFLPPGTREDLVARAIVKFGIKGKFDVPRSTIDSRIKADRLEVWQTGEASPVIMVEVTLNAYIIQAWCLNCPLSVSGCIDLMNSLINGTRFEAKLIAWKAKRGILDPNREKPLVGYKWWELFKRRNPEIITKSGRKWPRNRADHCHTVPFMKMYNQNEIGLVASG